MKKITVVGLVLIGVLSEFSAQGQEAPRRREWKATASEVRALRTITAEINEAEKRVASLKAELREIGSDIRARCHVTTPLGFDDSDPAHPVFWTEAAPETTSVATVHSAHP